MKRIKNASKCQKIMTKQKTAEKQQKIILIFFFLDSLIATD